MRCFLLLSEEIQFGFLRFSFLSHVQVFSNEISLVCCIKYPYSCFSSNFGFLVIFVLLMLLSPIMLLVTVISLPVGFSM